MCFLILQVLWIDWTPVFFLGWNNNKLQFQDLKTSSKTSSKGLVLKKNKKDFNLPEKILCVPRWEWLSRLFMIIQNYSRLFVIIQDLNTLFSGFVWRRKTSIPGRIFYVSRGGNDYQSTSPPLLALTRGKQKRDILLEIAVAIIIITIRITITKTVKFKKSVNSQCGLGSYRVQRVQNRKSSRSS